MSGALVRAALFFCIAVPAVAAEPALTLTNVSAVLQLPLERAAAELPVRLTAAVTYADPNGGILFVEDETGGILVTTKRSLLAFHLGDMVDINGRSTLALQLPAIGQAIIKSRGHSSLEAARPKLEDALARRFDGRFIELSGTVRQVGENRGRVSLLIEAQGGQLIEANFLQLTNSKLWDAAVRIRGVCGARGFKDSRALAIVLYCTHDEALVVERPGLSDAFAATPETFQSIATNESPRRVRVDGTVVGTSEGGTVTIEDSARERFSVEASGTHLLRTNDLVQVSGIPAIAAGARTFRYVELRLVAPPLQGPATNAPALMPVLTRVALVRRLGEKADRGQPVRIRGVVTYYDQWMLFVQDETSGIYVYPEQKKFPLHAGQFVEVEGFTHSGLYAPVINDAQITVLGENELPDARPLTAEILVRGQHDSQRVEVSGVVSSVVRDDAERASIELATTAGRLRVYLLLNGEDIPQNLIDAEVRLRGVCGSSFNQRKQFTGAILYVASTEDIIIEQPGAADSFALPAKPIASLLKFGSASLHRARITGTVTFADRRSSLLCVQDASGGVFVRVQAWTKVEPGDTVEALGFPVTGGNIPTLEQAAIRLAASKLTVNPKVLRVADALSGSHDAELVSIEARLLDHFLRVTNEILVLLSGEHTFEAQKPLAGEDRTLSSLEPQSIVRLTGVCSVPLNQASTSRAFRLLLRSSNDVHVLRVPVWWNDYRVRTVALSAGALVLTPIVWVGLLRRKVRQQTTIIRAQLERQQQSNDELEVKVAERTTELSEANKGLEQARAELELRVDERTAELSLANEALRAENAERERSERALRLSEERFQWVGRATNDAVWDWNPTTNQLWWGEGFETLFGYSRGEIEPGLESWFNRLHPLDKDRVTQAVRAIIENGGVSWTEEYRFRSADGSYRRVFDRGYVIRDAAGTHVRMVGAMVDITELKQAEESLRLSEERFSKAFRCSPVPMSISTVNEGRYIDVNDAYAKMLGFTREEMIGRTSLELGIWMDSTKRQVSIQTLREKGTVRDEYLDLRTRAGDGRHVLVSAESIVINNVDCLVAILSDVTERVQLEAQLRQSQKMEAVGQLAAGIAHDFNNMLTVILGHVALLKATSGDPDQTSSLAEVGDAADRAANLTRQLLTFSRRQPFRPRVLDVNEVIAGMSRMLQRILGEQISLHFRHASSLPGVQADPGMIEQIVMNLAVNARDAMPGGGWLNFQTSLRQIADDYLRRNSDASVGTFVCLTVSDTGCGMNTSTLDRIFEPFFTTKDVGKGTGLGLATVYGIVKQHGGWIEVTSETGRGTTFDIYLPALEKSAAASAVPAVEAPIRGGKETILVVEDESGVRDLARNILGRYGYEVLSACDGAEALEVWEKHRANIDLLLTDMVMPNGLSGRDLAERFRSEQPELKVVYTSGYSVEFEGELGLRENLNFLPKPYVAQRLAAVVRQCLDLETAGSGCEK